MKFQHKLTEEPFISELNKHFGFLKKPLLKFNGYIIGEPCLYYLSEPPRPPCPRIKLHFPIDTDIKDIKDEFSKKYPNSFITTHIDDSGFLVFHNNIWLSISKSHIYGSMEYVVDNYIDLSIHQIGYDFKTVYFGKHTLEDIKNELLRIVNFNDPETTYWNVHKYMGRGFKPTEYTLLMMDLF